LGELSVTELAKPFEMSLPAVSKHLKVLERAGVIRRGREAQWRPCQLDASPLKDVAEWVERYRRFWTESLDRLDDYLQEKGADATERRLKSRSFLRRLVHLD
jgi:DNA-binding transcriptional ArsR family regulator